MREMFKLCTLLLQLHEALRELELNGRKPRFRPIRYSVNRIYDSDQECRDGHEHIVKEFKKLMHLLR